MEQPFDLPAQLAAACNTPSGVAGLAILCDVSPFTALRWTKPGAIPPQRHHAGIAEYLTIDVEVVSAYCRAAWAKRGRR